MKIIIKKEEALNDFAGSCRNFSDLIEKTENVNKNICFL